MVEPAQIREHTEIIGSDGQHVCTVDHLESSVRIKLTKKDTAADGTHHYISTSWVESAEGERVKLNKTAQQAQDEWQSE